MDSIELVPAYGRDYTSKMAVQEAFDAGQDFEVVSLFGGNYGRYANNADLKDVRTIQIRYGKLMKVHVIYKK